MNSICIITNFRCGSSFLTSHLSKLYDLPFCGELLNPTTQWAIGNANKSATPFQKLEEIKKGARGVFKIMPAHARYNVALLEEFINASEMAFYLYRRDFRAQTISWVQSKITNSWANNGFLKTDDVRDLVNGEYGETVKYTIKVTQQYVDNCASYLKKNWEIIDTLCKNKQLPAICVEDFEIKKPYNKEFIWTATTPIELPDYDVESIFKNCQKLEFPKEEK